MSARSYLVELAFVCRIVLTRYVGLFVITSHTYFLARSVLANLKFASAWCYQFCPYQILPQIPFNRANFVRDSRPQTTVTLNAVWFYCIMKCWSSQNSSLCSKHDAYCYSRYFTVNCRCRHVSTFWIAHPNNTFINNSAAGSEVSLLLFIVHHAVFAFRVVVRDQLQFVVLNCRIVDVVL